MKIILDGMGGDHAPCEIVKGAVMALGQDKDLKVVITGDREQIESVLKSGGGSGHNALPLEYDKERLEIVHCTEVITNDDAPTLAIRKKKDSSLVVALKLLKEDEEAVGLVSAGSTGAVLTGALLRVGRIRGITTRGLSRPSHRKGRQRRSGGRGRERRMQTRQSGAFRDHGHRLCAREVRRGKAARGARFQRHGRA